MKYVVYGLGISGIATARFLAKNSESVTVTDDNIVGIENAKITLSDLADHIEFKSPDAINYDSNTIISFAPGIPLYYPKAHPILEISQKTGATISCDMELFYNRNKKNNYIGITGTNGKSTVSSLINFTFQQLGINCALGGNIGVPCFELAFKNDNSSDNTCIFETSSYQLDLSNDLHFDISALINITPDHIDRHGSFDNYIESKKRIFQNQTAEDFALIGVDNDVSKQVFDLLTNDPSFTAKLIPISTQEIQPDGLSLIDAQLINNINNACSTLTLDSQFLPGHHNMQNIAFAYAATYCHLIKQKLPIDENVIATAIKGFKGLRHRMQTVGVIDNINFINDSKATNAESTKNALKTYDNLFWILGGVEKEGGIETLTPYFKKIHKAYLIGEASDSFAQILAKNSVKFEKCDNLEKATKKAFFDAKNVSLSKYNILLSPACSSFDQWKNFEQRGDYFCKVFNELQKL